MFNLEGRAAIITGGNGGIGLGMGIGLANAGADIVIAARDGSKMQTARKLLEGCGARVLCVETDVRDEHSIQQMAVAASEYFGRIDILVNNAGTDAGGSADSLTLDEWNAVVETNLTSAFLCARAVYSQMQRQHGGKIINIGSMMSIFGHAAAPAYAASKGGIVQLTRSLACAWAGDNIQANAVLPGWIDTELTRGLRRQHPEIEQSVLDRTPAGRWGNKEDLAGIAVFLASAASDFVTGTAIPVDGGYAAQG